MRVRVTKINFVKTWGILPTNPGGQGLKEEYRNIHEVRKELRGKYGGKAERFIYWLLRAAKNLEAEMSLYEQLLYIEDGLQTFSAVMEEAEKVGIDVDPVVLADLYDATRGDYTLIREFFFSPKTEEEALLIWERLQRNFHRKGFVLAEALIKDRERNRDEWTDIAQKYLSGNPKKHLEHKRHRHACYFKGVAGVRISKKLEKVLDVLKDETENVSTFVSNLLLKGRVHQLDPKEVLEFNRRLVKKSPETHHGEKKAKTFILMLPAFLRWRVYSAKAGRAQRISNKERSYVGFAGVIWYLLFREFAPEVEL